MSHGLPEGAGKGKRAVLFKSVERFEAFKAKLEFFGVEVTVLDFDRSEWIDFDYSSVHFVIYYPSFENSSAFPLALFKTQDNLVFLHREFPHLGVYPDPELIGFYNDKYRQYLFLQRHGLPIPDTLPLQSKHDIDLAVDRFGFPLILKNRYGAGGGTVFKIGNRKELEKYFRLSRMDLIHPSALGHLARAFSKRLFWYFAIKEHTVPYPFLSPPLLAQRFITIDRDLKTVVSRSRVVEGHWRHQADASMWKMNIDDGGTGVWSEIPQEALDLSLKLAQQLGSTWLNIDLMHSGKQFLISEFSPVWHHYRYQEKTSFVYSDDYNLDPLEYSLDLERIIVESFLHD